MRDNKKSKFVFSIIGGFIIIPFIILSTFFGCGEDKSTNIPVEVLPQIDLTSISECKGLLDVNNLKASGFNQTCVEFTYDSTGLLYLRHTDMTANCCADSFSVNINMEDGIIEIVEEEIFLISPCHCICPYDIELEITDLAPGTYTISITEPYQHPGSPPLEFAINLAVPVSGQFCIYRE
ncbi:MAG: hypothetical protein V3V99_00015 [candidate division Zixibacteria bacterium]